MTQPLLSVSLSQPGLFITATDTGVGKTVVSCAIAAALRRAKWRVGVCKPMATGCKRERGLLINDDTLALAHFSDCRESLSIINPVAFMQPVAPAVAASEAGEQIDYDAISRSLAVLDGVSDVILVEGAGGVLVPIDPDRPHRTMIDLMVAIGYPVVIVTRATLGTLNHTAMTVRLLREAGLRIAGLVVNAYEADVAKQDDASMATNRAWMEKMNNVPVLATLPRCPVEQVQPQKGLISADILESAMLAPWTDIIKHAK